MVDVSNIYFRYIVQWGPGYGESAGFARHDQAIRFAAERAQRYDTRVVDNDSGREIWEYGPDRHDGSDFRAQLCGRK